MKNSFAHFLRLFTTFLIAASLISGPASAWKVDMHVWIAAEVLEDIQDGFLEFDLNGRSIRVAVPSRYTRAIRSHPKQFLLGSLGPDAFPDVTGGQLVIHPSYPGGWGTADWLQHLLSSPNMTNEELSFVLGYFTHAAADTFAHTFVNRYTGDVFELIDHPSAAIRHITVESLVSRHLPNISAPSVGRQTIASQLLRTNGQIAFPEALIRDRLLFDKAAVEQFNAGGAKHLALATQLYGNLDELLADNGLIAQLERDIADLALELATGLPIDDRITRELADAKRRLDHALNDAADDLRPVLNSLNDDLASIENFQVKVAQDALIEATRLTSEVASALLEIAERTDLLSEARSIAADIVDRGADTYQREVCSSWGRIVIGWKSFLACLATKHVTEVTKVYRDALNEIDLRQRLLREARNALPGLRNNAINAIREGFDVIESAYELRRGARSLVIDMVTNKPFGNNFRNHFERWRDGIPIAMVEFTRANAAAIVNSVDPGPNAPGLTEPLVEWLVCYGPVFLSVPATAGEAVCFTWDGVSDLRKEFAEFEQALADTVPILGEAIRLKQKVERKLEEVREEVFRQALLQGLGEFDKLARTPTQRFYKALSETATVASTNQEFSSDPSGQNLPLITDAGDRLFAEMAVGEQGTFDPEEFSAAYNSVVLSKLAMLDARGLQQIAGLAGVSGDTLFGPGLYRDGSPEARNILFGFLRSIDGNHQWHELAPPHPRSNQNGIDRTDFDRRYLDPHNFGFGYRDSGCNRVKGMRFWVDPVARQKVFSKIFKGDLALGIDHPEALEARFGDVLPPQYPTLFDAEEGWNEDGITLRGESAPWELELSASGQPNDKMKAFFGDRPIAEFQLDQIGQFSGSFDIPQHWLPGRLDVEEVGGRRSLIYSIGFGCDGTEVSPGQVVSAEILVKPGNSLWIISEKTGGDGKLYPMLFELNADRIRDPDLIYPDQILKLPWTASVTGKITVR